MMAKESFLTYEQFLRLITENTRLWKKAHLRKCAPTAWGTAVHGVTKSGHDLVTEQQLHLRQEETEIQEPEGLAPCRFMAEPQLELKTCLRPEFDSWLYHLLWGLALSNPPAYQEITLVCLPPGLAVRVLDARACCQELCKCRIRLHLFA